MANEPHIAKLTIYRPGVMSDAQRTEIASWLRKQADDLETEGEDYSEFKFTARYRFVQTKED